jgi:hypothetical protein
MLILDNRIGGNPVWVLSRNPRNLMQVPEEIRKTVVFLAHKPANGPHKLYGTAFVVRRDAGINGLEFHYLVTAKHVIDAIRNESGYQVYIRVNVAGGTFCWVETDLGDWIDHPTDQLVDATVLPLELDETVEYQAFPLAGIATENVIRELAIGPGDDVFVAGLYTNHVGETKNIRNASAETS